MYDRTREALTEYYNAMSATIIYGGEETEARNLFYKLRNKVYDEMEEFYKENPDTPPALLKSRIHTLVAEYAEPILFAENPYYYELRMRESESGGASYITGVTWMWHKMKDEAYKKHPICADLENKFGDIFDDDTITVGNKDGLKICNINRSFDFDHSTVGYRKLFKVGIKGIIDEACEQINKFPVGSDGYYYNMAIVESCNAAIKIAEKFAVAAEKKLSFAKTEKERQYLSLIARTARRVPAEPPKTFYEGLEMIMFAREMMGNLENIGISSLGHGDYLLGKLYEDDLAAGRITEEEARELLGIWMMHTDIKFDVENSHWPETSTCLQLGGCDENGEPVFNAVTKMFIEEHHRLGLINPKLNCRCSASSPEEYLKLIGRVMLKGHNNFALVNDDVIIPGLVRSGVDIRDARAYVNGGCQETMIEGCGHTEGAALYVSIPRLLDLFLRYDKGSEFLRPIDKADSFEEFYGKFMNTLDMFMSVMIDQRNIRHYYTKRMFTAPFFSSTQEGCIESGKDYADGGSKYNFTTIAVMGLGTVADSLQAIKTYVYDKKRLSLGEFIEILAKNWEGHEEFRKEILNMPKYGHNDKEVDSLADRFLTDISDIIREKKNARGGTHLPSLFVYYHYKTFSRGLRATPDGRRDFDLLSPGCSPSQLKGDPDATNPINSMNNVDYTACGGGNAVLDMMIPASSKITEEIFEAFVRSGLQLKCPTLQPNIISVDDLKDAKLHPEAHKDLIVRISGLSAYFVQLHPDVQDEIISRNIYSVG